MTAADYDLASTDVYHAVRQLCCHLESVGTDAASTSVSPHDLTLLRKLVAACGNKPWLKALCPA